MLTHRFDEAFRYAHVGSSLFLHFPSRRRTRTNGSRPPNGSKYVNTSPTTVKWGSRSGFFGRRSFHNSSGPASFTPARRASTSEIPDLPVMS